MKKKLVLFSTILVLLIFIGFVGAASPKKTIKFKNANV
jgi:hypothetical protein